MQPTDAQPIELTKEELMIKFVYTEKISRLFIFRGFWVYVIIWVIVVWGVWEGFIFFLHFWYKLFLGKRKESWWKSEVRFFTYLMKWSAYIRGLIDQRPKVIED